MTSYSVLVPASLSLRSCRSLTRLVSSSFYSLVSFSSVLCKHPRLRLTLCSCSVVTDVGPLSPDPIPYVGSKSFFPLGDCKDVKPSPSTLVSWRGPAMRPTDPVPPRLSSQFHYVTLGPVIRSTLRRSGLDVSAGRLSLFPYGVPYSTCPEALSALPRQLQVRFPRYWSSYGHDNCLYRFSSVFVPKKKEKHRKLITYVFFTNNFFLDFCIIPFIFIYWYYSNDDKDKPYDKRKRYEYIKIMKLTLTLIR